MHVKTLSSIPPAPCHKHLIENLESIAVRKGYNHMRMPSGAGHDTQFFTKHIPAAMFFIPSKNGVSHSPKEHTSLSQIEVGTNFLLDALVEILRVK